MKYLIIVPDGAADESIEALGAKTPLEAADMQNINQLAQKSEVGLVQTIPDGVAPGSDAANLAVMGYDPKVYLTGRSPLEAVSIGIDMSPEDVAFRCNLITLEGEGSFEDMTVVDHSAGDITTEEAGELIAAVNEAFETKTLHFYTGTSYRNLLITNGGHTNYDLTPPHDILGRQTAAYLPKGEGADWIRDMMLRSCQILKDHPVNKARAQQGLRPANAIWIWGQGKKPKLDSFYDKYGVKGAVVSAVDLIKGIGLCAGLEAVHVEGATGTLHTDFDGKAKAAIQCFQEGKDFVYLHLEAPDECSHQGDLEGKIKALELIDQKVAGPVSRFLAESGEDYRILIVPDHQTPVRLRTHTSGPVPYVLYDSAKAGKIDEESQRFDEASAEKGTAFEKADALADYFFRGTKTNR